LIENLVASASSSVGWAFAIVILWIVGKGYADSAMLAGVIFVGTDDYNVGHLGWMNTDCLLEVL